MDALLRTFIWHESRKRAKQNPQKIRFSAFDSLLLFFQFRPRSRLNFCKKNEFVDGGRRRQPKKPSLRNVDFLFNIKIESIPVTRFNQHFPTVVALLFD